MDFVSWREKHFVLVIESKRVGLEDARKQCFLAMKDMRDNNGGGVVCGFLAVVTCDGSFRIGEGMVLIFDAVHGDKEKWLKDNPILVDSLNGALNYGGNMD